MRSKAACQQLVGLLFPCRKDNDKTRAQHRARLKTHIITIHLYHNSYHHYHYDDTQSGTKRKIIQVLVRKTNNNKHNIGGRWIFLEGNHQGFDSRGEGSVTPRGACKTNILFLLLSPRRRKRICPSKVICFICQYRNTITTAVNSCVSVLGVFVEPRFRAQTTVRKDAH